MNRKTTILLAVMCIGAANLLHATIVRAEPATQPTTVQAEKTVQVISAYARPPGGAMKVGALFGTIKNTGGQNDRLIAVQCDAAKTVEIHETKMDGEMMRMRPVKALEIPAGSTLELKPGSNHVMLIGVEKPLVAGDKVDVVFVFESAGEQAMQVELKDP